MEIKQKENKNTNNRAKNPTLTPYTILVVEDDKDLSELIRRRLQKEGLQIKCVLNGSDAIAWIVEHPNTLVLLDYQLPDMSGLNIIETLNEKKCTIPFILMTAHSDVKLAVKMMKLGARDFLEKDKGFLRLLPTIVTQVMDQLETENKLTRAKEDLRISEERFRSVVDNIGVGIALISPKMEILSLNKQMQRWFPEIDVSKKPTCYRVYNKPPKDQECSFCPTKKSLKDGQVHQAMMEIPAGDKIKYYRIVTSPNKDEDGKVLAAIKMIEDITEQKQAEDALRESEERFRAVTQSANEAIISTDSDGNIIAWNMSAQIIFGYTENEMMTKPVIQLIPERFRVAQCNKIKQILTTGEKNGSDKTAELLGLRKDCSEFPIELSLASFQTNEGRFYTGILRDITQRKQAEEALRNAHAETEQLLSSISSILIGVGPDHCVTRWNEIATKTFGINETEVLGKLFFESGIKWDWDLVQARISECKANDKSTQLDDIRYTRPDEKEGFLRITFYPILNEANAQAGYLLLAADTTEHKSLESQLAQAQKLESIGQLAAGIAHEINTPIQYVGDNTRFLDEAFSELNGLLTHYNHFIKTAENGAINKESVKVIETAVEEADLDYLIEEIPNAIQQSLEGVEHVAKIVRSMKEFSHPGAEDMTTIDINRAIESTITVSRNEWKYIADMVTNFDVDLPLVPCFPGEINQVILNIIINAAHAITDVVGYGAGQKGTITISTQNVEDWVEIRINDTGAGIPENVRQKIFDPFFTTKEIGQGTGQGLAISHNVVVEKHKGILNCETETGKGTTFIICLPLNPIDSKRSGENNEETNSVRRR